jgi:imidazolonepropionase-like amidohydrolase
MPARDLAMEALVEVLDGKRTVHFHTHRHDDIITVIRLSQEFGFKPVLQHVSEGWKVADEIAKAGLAASLTVVDSPGGKLETLDVAFKTAAVLDKAGVLVGFNTDDPITDSRIFLRSAGLAVRAGLSRDKALYAMTMAGARMLGLDSRIGSLEAGKDADFLVLSGDPLSVYTTSSRPGSRGRRCSTAASPRIGSSPRGATGLDAARRCTSMTRRTRTAAGIDDWRRTKDEGRRTKDEGRCSRRAEL